jgi:hypothetical protein
VHETPLSALCVAELGAGVAGAVQVVPFQSSENGVSAPESPRFPTAMQLFGEMHEMATSSADWPGGFGVGTIAHLPALQRSTMLWSVLVCPPAKHAVAEGHETPCRYVDALFALGTDCRAHVLPFQRAARAPPAAKPELR